MDDQVEIEKALKFMVLNAPEIIMPLVCKMREEKLAALPEDFVLIALAAFFDGMAAWGIQKQGLQGEAQALNNLRETIGCAGWDFAELAARVLTDGKVTH